MDPTTEYVEWARCPVCDSLTIFRLPGGWEGRDGVIRIVGCGNPWHYATRSLGDSIKHEAAAGTPDVAALREALLERIRIEVREAVMEGDAQDCSSADCISDAVYEIVRAALPDAPARQSGDAALDVERLAAMRQRPEFRFAATSDDFAAEYARLAPATDETAPEDHIRSTSLPDILRLAQISERLKDSAAQ